MESIDTLNEVIAMSAVLAPIVLGLVQIIKAAFLPEKYAGIVSLFLGVIIFCSITQFTMIYIIGGLIVGLTASGLWSNGKTIIEK